MPKIDQILWIIMFLLLFATKNFFDMNLIITRGPLNAEWKNKENASNQTIFYAFIEEEIQFEYRILHLKIDYLFNKFF